MVEFYKALSALVVFAVDGGLVDGPPVDSDGPVGPVLAQDCDLGLDAALLDQVTALLELKRSGLCSFEKGH